MKNIDLYSSIYRFFPPPPAVFDWVGEPRAYLKQVKDAALENRVELREGVGRPACRIANLLPARATRTVEADSHKPVPQGVHVHLEGQGQ